MTQCLLQNYYQTRKIKIYPPANKMLVLTRLPVTAPATLDSGIILERRSYFEWAFQAPQRGAGPAPDRGAISYYATILGKLSAVLPVF